MAKPSSLSRIDLHLVEILHTLLVTHSVSQTAIRHGMHAPAVSAALARLRELTGDPLLVRAGRAMVPTEAGRALLAPAAEVLAAARRLFGGDAHVVFSPATTDRVFRIAASDFLDPSFLPLLVAQIKAQAPLAGVEIVPLTADADYRQRLAAGELDLVVGNWLRPPSDLHIGRLFQDEIVCLVAEGHPAPRRGWTLDKYLACEHIAPTPAYPGALGVIDELLAQSGLRRRIGVRCPHFALTPAMVAGSLLVLTTGRLFCARFTAALPVRIVPCPVPMPGLRYYQLWHDRTQRSAACRWLREQVRRVAAGLR
jgi:DNA-binding transcriptional LysR family regulator